MLSGVYPGAAVLITANAEAPVITSSTLTISQPQTLVARG
jgi:hypothetical protein